MGFEYRKLIVYQRAMQYDEIANKLLPYVRKRDRSLASHLARSGNSMITNIAEGASEDRPLIKAACYRVAKREGEECALGWDKALARGYTPRAKTDEALAFLHECVLMLAGLIRRHDPRDVNPMIAQTRRSASSVPNPNPNPNPNPGAAGEGNAP